MTLASAWLIAVLLAAMLFQAARSLLGRFGGLHIIAGLGLVFTTGAAIRSATAGDASDLVRILVVWTVAGAISSLVHRDKKETPEKSAPQGERKRVGRRGAP